MGQTRLSPYLSSPYFPRNLFFFLAFFAILHFWLAFAAMQSAFCLA
jgi:hypothetical protein